MDGERGAFGCVDSHLEPTFGQVRAEAIAATETTRAFAEGTLLSYRQSGLVLATSWKTSVDERVCPICRPLHGAIGDLKWQFPSSGRRGKAFRYEGRMFRPQGMSAVDAPLHRLWMRRS